MSSKLRNQRLTRREFGAVTAGVALIAGSTKAASVNAAAAAKAPLDIAEWSFFWVGIERADLGKGTVITGKQMYVEYQIPAKVKHPYPIVLVHGGGGQGLDWMGTPDGRRGWSTYLLQEGYMVYVVDRPGHGKSPYHPDLHGPFPMRNLTLDQISGSFTPQRAKGPTAGAYAKFHNQWPGTGEVGSRELAQLVASQGGSYGNGPGTGMDPAHLVWRQRGAELLDKIGPAIIMTHSAGGPFGYLVAEVRPKLVKGIVVVEGAGVPFAQNNRWGLSSVPVEFTPPINDPSELKTKQVTSNEEGGAAVSPPGRARAETEKLAGHSDGAGHGRRFFRRSRRTRRARVPEAGRVHGRRIALERLRRPRQRPSDDGRKEQPGSAPAHSQLDRQERVHQGRARAQAAQ